LRYYGVLSDLHDCGGGIRATAARHGTTCLDQPFVVGSDRFSGDFIARLIPVRAHLVRSWSRGDGRRSLPASSRCPEAGVALRLGAA
jgi:hypothetical protein